MRRLFMIGIVVCLCSVIVPASASSARSGGARAGRATSSQSEAGRSLLRRAWAKAAAGHPVSSNATRSSSPSGSPTVTADPSSGLLDGQVIAVTGDNFTTKTLLGIIECQTGATDITGCDIGISFSVVKSDSSGSFSTPDTVLRTITPSSSGTPIDCATPGACILAVAPQDGTIAASTPISFSDVAIIPPTVAADPSTGLLDGQKINVSGTNFGPDAPLLLAECPAGTSLSNIFNCDISTFASATADTSGAISSTYKVTRVIAGQSGPIDCAGASACELVAFNFVDQSQVASTPISFADVAIIPPVLTASPSTGLVDGQSVTVTGSGFRAHDSYLLSECAAGSTDGSECVATSGIGYVSQVQAKRSGKFTTTVGVARVLTLINGTVDCAQAPGCVIGAINENDPFGAVAAVAPVSFDPSVKPLPPLNLVLHIDPTGHIVAGPKGRAEPQIGGRISCARSTPLPVQIQVQVTQPSGGLQGGVIVSGQATCDRNGAKFTATVPTLKGQPAVPGIAGVLLAVSAISGSATESTTISASVTLKSK